MNGEKLADWLCNAASNPFGTSDVGYFVGHEIARCTFAAAGDGRLAIMSTIELNYRSPTAVDAFIARFGYLDGRCAAPRAALPRRCVGLRRRGPAACRRDAPDDAFATLFANVRRAFRCKLATMRPSKKEI